MRADDPVDHHQIRDGLHRIRAADGDEPAVSVVIPVNAQGDLENVLRIVGDLARYDGPHTVEVILVINNYDDAGPPREIQEYRDLGVRTLGVSSVRQPGEAVGFSARIPGVREARSEAVLLFDADCRIPHPTPLIDWYVEQFRSGAEAAYTRVGHHDYVKCPSVRVQFWLHHAARWIKRNVLRIPTTRGSNYAVRRGTMLRLYEQRVLADEMNVGPTFKRLAGRVAYCGRKDLVVLTSGRMFKPGWTRILPYFLYRLRYNLRVLPVRKDVAQRTGRERDPVRRYVDNRPVRP